MYQSYLTDGDMATGQGRYG